jgi:hypothetical protein
MATNKHERNYLRFVEAQQNEVINERNRFQTQLTLSIYDLETIICLLPPGRLSAKLQGALKHAEQQFKIRDVDFGDLKED